MLRSILPPPVKGWVASRDLPPVAAKEFPRIIGNRDEPRQARRNPGPNPRSLTGARAAPARRGRCCIRTHRLFGPPSLASGRAFRCERSIGSFQKNAVQLKTDLQLVAGVEEAVKTWSTFATPTNGWRPPPITTPCWTKSCPTLGLETLYTGRAPRSEVVGKCSVGITACDALVSADRLDSAHFAKRRRPRPVGVAAASLVIARADQLVPDLPAACRPAVGPVRPGPSRLLSPSSRARVGPATLSEFWSWAPMVQRISRSS